MKLRSTMMLAAVLSTLLFAGCKKPPEPTNSPATPEPNASTQDSSQIGKTTNFENPQATQSEQPSDQ